MVFLGKGRRVPKMSLALGQPPRLHRCNLGVAPEQETFWGLSGPRPERLLAPSLIDFRGNAGIQALYHQRIAKGAGGKGPRQKTSKIVKKCQKVSRHFSTIFAQGKKRQKPSKSVKKFFDTFRQFSRGTFFPAPFAIR